MNINFRTFSRFSPLLAKGVERFSQAKASPRWRWGRYLLGSSIIAFPFAMNYFWNMEKSRKMEEVLKKADQLQREQVYKMRGTHVKSNESFLMKAYSILAHIVRFFQLAFIFTPCIALLPLRMFDRTREMWLDLFVITIERAGVIWIKSFQYLSHRRDIIGQELAEKFIHLRQHAPEHPFEETKNNFRSCYGKEINEIFEQFDQKPIASGSVSQVYKAKYQGKVVAVKVRHPGVEKYIERDINLLFFLSRVLSIFSKTFVLPVTQESMKKTMSDQINFINEKENLEVFQKLFSDRNDVNFPTPFAKPTTDSVLVETFVDGVPITYYENNQHVLRPVIARLGAEAFFDMLIKHNFIHADAHGGNIMVVMKQRSFTFFGEVWEWLKEKIIRLEDKIVASNIESELLRKIYIEGREEAAAVREVIRNAMQKVTITIIDTGMVITLSEKTQQNFLSFIQNVLDGNGSQCAQQIYSLSSHGGEKLQPNQNPKYAQQLHELFKVVDKKDLENLPGLELFAGMLNIIREHEMKLEGEFATLLTNMLVLEGMAKQIHPQINILKVALPYFSKIQENHAHEIPHFD